MDLKQLDRVSQAFVKGKLSPAHIVIMCACLEQQVRMSDLAVKLGHSTAACTGNVDRLESRRLVERHHAIEDRREITVSTTTEGRAFLKQALEQINNHSVNG